MDSHPQATDSSAFDDLPESRLLKLLSRIGEASTEEIETELKSLNALIDSYAHKDELIEGLLDPRTSEDDRSRMRKALAEQSQQLEHSRAELQRLREKSQAILARSVQLLRAGCRHLFQKRTFDGSRYAPEICGYCAGVGRRNREACPACGGERLVLVYQPALKCPRCDGNGRPNAQDRIEFSQDFCVICRGKGWAMTAQ